MTELSFAKTFLSTLDARTVKLKSDHAADLKTLELKSNYILPSMPHPMRPRTPKAPAAPGSAPSTTISLKSLRNPQLDLSLPAHSLTTSVLQLKQTVAEKLGLEGTEKIRLLYKKKPCSDAKSVKDVLGEETAGGEVEFSVMIIGSVAEGSKGEEGKTEGPVADAVANTAGGQQEAPDPRAEMEKEDFWTGLKGFVKERVKDEGVAEEVVSTFKSAWSFRR